jgi:hypothetical protein
MVVNIAPSFFSEAAMVALLCVSDDQTITDLYLRLCAWKPTAGRTALNTLRCFFSLL